MLARVVGVALVAASAVVVTAFGAVMALLFAWQPVEEVDYDDGDDDEGGVPEDDEAEGGEGDW